MPDYTKPTIFTRGQLLGRANLSILRDNDDYFWGLAHGWRTIPGNLNSTDENGVLFDGWHYYKADSTDLAYYVTMNAGADSGARIHMYYDYGGDNEVQFMNMQAPGTDDSLVLGNYDVSVGNTRAEGLYRVYCKAKYGCSGYCRPPYTVYTGDQAYGTPAIQWDGDRSDNTFYNRVRLNDLYFNDCKPTNIAFSGMEQRTGAGVNCWDGWDYHHGTRLYYRLVLSTAFGGGDWFRIYYDYGGANEQVVKSFTTSGTKENYADIDTTSYTYNPGQRYRVTCRMNSGAKANVEYLFIEPQTTDPGPGIDPAAWRYYVMDEFTVGNIVLGRIPPAYGPSTVEVSLLSDNDRHIFAALCASAKIGRRDYAVRTPTVTEGGLTYTGDLHIIHRYDTLIHRTSGADMTWGTDTGSLDDYGDDAYKAQDLRGLDLTYGQVYTISGDEVDYAAEIP